MTRTAIRFAAAQHGRIHQTGEREEVPTKPRIGGGVKEIDLDRSSDIHLPFRPTVFSRTLRLLLLSPLSSSSSSSSRRTLQTLRRGPFVSESSVGPREKSERSSPHCNLLLRPRDTVIEREGEREGEAFFSIALVIRPDFHSRLTDGFISNPTITSPAATICLPVRIGS